SADVPVRAPRSPIRAHRLCVYPSRVPCFTLLMPEPNALSVVHGARRHRTSPAPSFWASTPAIGTDLSPQAKALAVSYVIVCSEAYGQTAVFSSCTPAPQKGKGPWGA